MKLRVFTSMLVILMAVGIGFVGCESYTEELNPSSNSKDANELAFSDAAKGNGKGGDGAAPSSGATANTCSAQGTEAGHVGECPSVMSYEYTLWAGKHNDAGIVKIWADETNIYVEYNTNETADLKEAHVYVWTNEAGIPAKRPAPGQAPYKAENINADSYTFTIPASSLGITDLCGATLYISTHAALIGEGGVDDGTGNAGETAYTGDPTCFDNQKGAWWGYASFTVECYYEVSGTVYEDANNNGRFDAGESVFAGITVTTGGYSATTDAAGYYSFLLSAGADYDITSGTPSGDYDAYEGAGGISLGGLSACLENQNFGFVPLYDLSVSVTINGDMNCFSNSTITINGVSADELLNQLPGKDYIVVVTAYDAGGNILASETVNGELTQDTQLSLSLTGWTCPEPPPVDCNDCADGELVVHGSFEDELSNGWNSNYYTSTGGWSALLDRGNWPGAATDGNWTLDLIGSLDNLSAAGYLEQTLCTDIGEEYNLTFDVNLTGQAYLVVTIGGVDHQVTSSGSKSIAFTASSGATTIRFAGAGNVTQYQYRFGNSVFLDNVSVACGDGGPGTGGGSETAYMYGNWSFCDEGGQSRWGWANYITPGQTITQPIFAGAGQCDITKGTVVGTASLVYNLGLPGLPGSLTLTIEYNAPYQMNNIHVNIGDPFAISPNMTSNGNFNNNPTGISYPTSTFSRTYQTSGAGEYVIVHMEAIQ